MGGTKSPTCNTIATDVWRWCAERHIWLSAAHIAGQSNFIADLNSRTFNEATEWALNLKVFHNICTHFGSPVVDIMASASNHKVATYVSWHPDEHAFAIDAFNISWRQFSLIYCFPPFNMIGKCLMKIQRKCAEAILVIPCWTTQTWFPQALRMLVQTPLLYSAHPKLLVSPGSEDTHPLAKKLSLLAIRVSGKHLPTQNYRMQLPTSSLHPGDPPHSANITSYSGSGSCFALNDRLIPTHKPLIVF